MICPCKGYSRWSPFGPQVTAIEQRTTTRTERIDIVYITTDVLDWHVGLQLPGMEGQLLSIGSARCEDAAILRGAVPDRRDQLHVLSNAERKTRQWLGGANSVAVQAHVEGSSAYHPRRSAPKLWRLGQRILFRRGDARGKAGGPALPTAAECQEGPAAVRRILGCAAAEGA